MSDLEAYVATLPHRMIGVEHEYKWLLPADHPLAGGEARDLIADSGLPDGYAVVGAVNNTKSGVYLDDPKWTLADAALSLTVLVNNGWTKELSWLVLKETAMWEEGRRDAVEFAERIDPAAVAACLRDWQVLPLTRLTALVGTRPELAPYATITQRRSKADVATARGSLLSLTVDHSEMRAARSDRESLGSSFWVEIEANQNDGRSLIALARWAGLISDRLGSPPCHHTKPAWAASSLGWSGNP